MALKYQTGAVTKKWMKSQEGYLKSLRVLCKRLNLRESSPTAKMGGVHFYDHDDIQKVLEAGKVNNNQQQ